MMAEWLFELQPAPCQLVGQGASWFNASPTSSLARHHVAVAAATASRLCRGCVGSRTLDWVRSTAAHLPRVPSLAFIHIPVPQLVDLYNHFPTVGQKNEGVTCPEAADPGVFAALK